MRILIVEDEKDLADAIARGLRKQGYATDIALDGEAGLVQAEVNNYDMVVLDLNLPRMDGIEVCKILRKTNKTIGILMLTARSSLNDRVIGLDQGADDYLVKPFYFQELLARIHAILRREGTPRLQVLKNKGIELDPNTYKIAFNGKELAFSSKEFAILEYLMRNTSRLVSQEEIIEHVWDQQANPFTQTIKVHIMNIRKKLADAGAGELISTVKGKGYIL
ncbi:MAG: response regulator transcription factor [Chloroflexi bacterium]|nr:response regulator transcription factor [Chloroflexota bacterium]